MKIEDEIKQKTFPNEFLKANVNMVFTNAWVQLKVLHELKPFNISPQQFNVLRILRGCHPKPASIRELTDRMLDKASNASRLVDKLLLKGFVSKATCISDNRKMEVVITEEGLKILEKASEKVESKIVEIYSALSEEEARQVNHLLDKLRG